MSVKFLVTKPEDAARSEEASLKISLQPLRLNVDQVCGCFFSVRFVVIVVVVVNVFVVVFLVAVLIFSLQMFFQNLCFQFCRKAKHCLKSVQMRRYFCSKYRKIQTRNNSAFSHFSRSESFKVNDH